RDEYYNRDDAENENIAELIIAKNRNGPTTSVRLQFQKEILQFRNLERER
ncbi:MAG: replicative DNA helicase, partial [Selenomonadaceae bacterium]|nr:replicative DNA helicase [Selenomonadaceae bacterium]